MPRIDPAQLLKCLSVLLSPEGGIKSKGEVQRLAGLMAKFSKKLVSKCIYVQILKKTEPELLGAFMASDGWTLVHMWLDDGIKAKNWPLIKELLELLLLCPVDVEILKINNCPKLVKELSKLVDQDVVQVLAAKVVEQWLKLVKGETTHPLDQINHISIDKFDLSKDNEGEATVTNNSDELTSGVTSTDESDSKDNPLPILKISVKDGKQVVSKISEKSDRKTSDNKQSSESIRKSSVSNSGNTEKDIEKNKKKKISNKLSSDTDRLSSSTSKKHSTGERRHSSSSSNSDYTKSKHKSKSSISHRDSDKDKKISSRNKTDKYRDHEKSKDRSEKNKEHFDKRKDEKNKDDKKKESLDKLKDQPSKSKESPKFETSSIMKLGKIPKKSSADKSDVKKEKPSLSIEVRNPNDCNRPKTVKTFNSKFRSHGLEEEAKPPPPRGSVKKSPTAVLPSAPKRPSPIRTFDAPPEKKTKISENVERPGSIKLIPPKPKPAYLLESGSFMDALTASATNKKEPRKRKRRISGSKDSTAPGDVSPPTSPSTPQTPTSPAIEESKSTPLRFYQDTLDTEEEEKDKENISKSPLSEEKNNQHTESPLSPCDKDDENISIKIEIKEEDTSPPPVLPGGLKSVLTVHKRKGPKKSLTWRENIQDVQYFELDETERVNVTKTFLDMKQMEHNHEREAFKKGRNLTNEDFMEEKTIWRKLIPIDIEKDSTAKPGQNSKEKEIQKARQEKVLQAIYFHTSKIPDSPAEADHEVHPVAEPVVIPLDDVSGCSDGINNFVNTPWPEPKTMPPPVIPNPNMPNPQMFPAGPPFNPGFNGPPFGGPAPGYQQGIKSTVSGEWQMNMMGDGMSNPEMYMGPGPGPGPGPGGIFAGQMNDYQMMEGGSTGFSQSYPGQMGPGGPPMGMNRPMGPYGYKNRGGGPRGPTPRGGHMGWRSKGPGNWSGPHRGGGGHRGNGRLCTHFMKKGFCRHGDACPFVHSGSGRY